MKNFLGNSGIFQTVLITIYNSSKVLFLRITSISLTYNYIFLYSISLDQEHHLTQEFGISD